MKLNSKAMPGVEVWVCLSDASWQEALQVS